MNLHRLGCIIPTYRQKRLLQKHLPAVLKTLSTDDLLTIIEDGQDQETIQFLCKTFNFQKGSTESLIAEQDLGAKSSPSLSALADQVYVGVSPEGVNIQVLQTKTNQRFAGAVNLAVAVTNAEYIGLLNNDVSPAADWASTTIRVLAEHRDGFGVGCLEYSTDKKSDPSGRNLLWFERGIFQHSAHPEQKSGITAWVSGGSGVFLRTRWMALQGFDPDFAPAYWEDIDVCYRARQRGWQSYFTSETHVIHQHESTHADVFGTQKMIRMSWKNGRKFTWKHATVLQKILFLIWWPYWQVKQYQSLRTQSV